jgi:2-polyprenyl-3-methyl-5-hydroxy-6-metoxy-1,4-benzoquinol methylase
MRTSLIGRLCCPRSGQALEVTDALHRGDQIQSGWLISKDGKNRYEIRAFVPRFVSESNYADSFGMQWNKFRATQLDSYSGHPISADRFWEATCWKPADIAGKWVLDVGCGAGRFAEVALEVGAHVVALDYSNAVDACYMNLGDSSRLHVVQGDIYSLPFEKRQFDFVYCLGVLQHTPDVGKAFENLPPMVSPGGRLCVDFYERSWKSSLLPKYWLRPFTKHVSKARLFATLEHVVPRLLPISRLLSRFPLLGHQLKRIVPVANYFDVYPLNNKQQLEWSLLDTFDWFSPEYDNPQARATVRRWFEEACIENIEVLKAGHLVGRGVIPTGDANTR